MFEPGYYRTSYSALRLREMVQWYGRYRGFWAWLKSRFKAGSSTGTWMPGLWAENECKRDDLSQNFWDLTRRHRANFEQLGFVQCRLSRINRTLNPQFRDTGSIFYLDPTRCYFGQLIYSQHYIRAKHKVFNHIVLAFTAVFESGSFSCTNHKLAFDSVNRGEVIRIISSDVIQIYDRFREELQRRGNKPRAFADVGALRQWFDERQIKDFEDRVRRGLFVRMTEREVADAEAEMQRYGPGGTLPPRPRRKIRIEGMPAGLVLILVVVVLVLRYWQMSGSAGGNDRAMNTIDYQGQQFNLSRAYTEYDDYKDDPNNLDTNELPRIERAMESVKIPAIFKDYKEFIYVTGNLTFPGYGESAGGGQTDDGSKLLFDSTEIPQADKERVVVARSESDGSWKLVDDFIYEGSDTNDINRVRLEHRQLEYFDQRGRLVRKKAL